MTPDTSASPAPLASLERIPPLESGDHLTLEEFERRYDAMPALKKAELIEGVVYVPSPVRIKEHGQPHAWITAWLVTYEAATPGVQAADNSSVQVNKRSMPQPDALLRVRPEYGGQSRTNEKGYVEAAPELAAEVAATTASLDLNLKMHVYRRSGVREYVVWRTYETAIDWFVLRDGAFERQAPDKDGIYHSAVFPGLWLDARALLLGDMARVLATLSLGIQSAEHQAFTARLKPVPPPQP